MIILVTANNYLLMFVGWEGVGICSYLLVSFWFTRIAANQSSMSAFLTNRVGDCFLTIGMFAIIWTFGNLDYATVFSLAPFVNENIVTIIGICLLIGAMAKSSQVGQRRPLKNEEYSCFFRTLIYAGKISKALESAGPVAVHKFSNPLKSRLNIRGVRYYSTDLTIWGKDLGSRVGVGLNKREKDMISLTNCTKNIIIGLMLSKGRVQRSNAITSNPRLRIGQPMEYSIYIWYLHYLLSPYCSTYPYLYKRKNKFIGIMELRTRSLACFMDIYNLFYLIESNSDKKILPSNIYDILTREALAHWFIASKVFFFCKKRDSNVILASSSFSLIEIIKLMNVLLIKYEINSTLDVIGNNYIIKISENSHLNFKSILNPYFSNVLLTLLGLNNKNFLEGKVEKTEKKPSLFTSLVSFGLKELPTKKGKLVDKGCLQNVNSTNSVTSLPRSTDPHPQAWVGASRRLTLVWDQPKASLSTPKSITDPEKFQRQGINQQELDRLTIYNKLVNLLQDKNFLDWFIGFTEGDGSFVLAGGKSIFSIHLHMADLPLLYIIQNELNMGNVYLKKDSAQYIVKSKRDVSTLISIFNGNLFLHKKQEQFNIWVINYNIKNKTNITLKSYKFSPSLNDSWLAGFIDAEGCFTVSIVKNRERIAQKFILVQKAADLEMKYLTELIGGIFYKDNKEMCRVHLAYSKCDSLIEYLSRHKLYSIKSLSFSKWKEIYDYRKNKPSDIKHDYPILKKKASLINQIRKVACLVAK
jgi:hypothetical protein